MSIVVRGGWGELRLVLFRGFTYLEEIPAATLVVLIASVMIQVHISELFRSTPFELSQLMYHTEGDRAAAVFVKFCGA